MPRQQSFIQVFTETLPYLAIAMAGDVGPFTTYTNKNGRIVFFPRSPPEKPASDAQLAQRQKFRDVAAAWKALTPAKRADWNKVQYTAHLSITGYDLFTWWKLGGDTDQKLATIARQGGVTLP
jgi:hypothetical protein